LPVIAGMIAIMINTSLPDLRVVSE